MTLIFDLTTPYSILLRLSPWLPMYQLSYRSTTPKLSYYPETTSDRLTLTNNLVPSGFTEQGTIYLAHLCKLLIHLLILTYQETMLYIGWGENKYTEQMIVSSNKPSSKALHQNHAIV